MGMEFNLTTSQLIKHEKQKELRRKKEAQLLKQIIHNCFAEQAKRLKNS